MDKFQKMYNELQVMRLRDEDPVFINREEGGRSIELMTPAY